MNLAVPLSASQIAAADRLYAQLPGWVSIDRALYVLHNRLPGFDPEVTLLKVVAINQLYGTRLLATTRMAGHIVEVLAARSATAYPDVDLVERIADLPQVKHFTSFASKFAHFFVDAERFPLYDTYVRKMVACHLGQQNEIRDAGRPYLAFVQNLRTLRESTQLTCTTSELDRYLWLAGVYSEWRRNRDAQINAEAKSLFQAPSTDAAADLNILLPTKHSTTVSL